MLTGTEIPNYESELNDTIFCINPKHAETIKQLQKAPKSLQEKFIKDGIITEQELLKFQKEAPDFEEPGLVDNLIDRVTFKKQFWQKKTIAKL